MSDSRIGKQVLGSGWLRAAYGVQHHEGDTLFQSSDL